MTEVRLTSLTKTYPGEAGAALDALTLDIPSGSLTALLGPSGCGKTTAMKMIAGLLSPSAGDVTFDGRSVLNDPPEARGAVMVFQNHLLFPHLSVADNVGFGLRMRGRPKAEVRDRVAEILGRVRLPDLGPRMPSELSGGQQPRIALARALVLRPKVLLLDEPLSNLDAHLRLEMRDLIRGLQQEMGITTLFVTHDQEEAVVLADRVALILNGKLCQYDVAEAFYKRPASVDVARFFGGQNFVPGRSGDGLFQSALGPLQLPQGAARGAGLLTVRPEAVRLGPAPVNSLTATVTARIFLGTQTRLKLSVNDIPLEAVVPPDAAEGVAVGEVIDVNLPPGALWVLPHQSDRRAAQ